MTTLFENSHRRSGLSRHFGGLCGTQLLVKRVPSYRLTGGSDN